MSRSKWKGPFANIEKNLKKKHQAQVASRNSEITPNLIGETFKIYSGKTYKEIVVTEEMIGHKFGEFVFTRVKFVFKKKKLKK